MKTELERLATLEERDLHLIRQISTVETKVDRAFWTAFVAAAGIICQLLFGSLNVSLNQRTARAAEPRGHDGSRSPVQEGVQVAGAVASDARADGGTVSAH